MLNQRAATLILCGLISLGLLVWWSTSHYTPLFQSQSHIAAQSRRGRFDGKWNYKRDAANLMLNSRQCDQAFPGLFEEVDRPVQLRRGSHITVSELDEIPKQNGYVRAMIFDQQVCIYL